MYLKGNNNLWREGSLDLDSINVLSQSCFIFPLFPSWFSVLILSAKRRSVLFLFSYKRLRLESICLWACHQMNQKYRCVFFLKSLIWILQKQNIFSSLHMFVQGIPHWPLTVFLIYLEGEEFARITNGGEWMVDRCTHSQLIQASVLLMIGRLNLLQLSSTYWLNTVRRNSHSKYWWLY